MNLIYCLGQLPDFLILQMESGENCLIFFQNSKDLLSSIAKKSPLFVLIQNSLFEEPSIKKIVDIPFVVFTLEEENLQGIEYMRQGAIDYLSVKNNEFVSCVFSRISQFLNINKKNFVHKILKESEWLYSSIVEHAPLYIFVCNREGEILVCNHLMQDFLNHNGEHEQIDKVLDEVLVAEFMQLLLTAKSGHLSHKFQCALVSRHQSPIPVRWHISSFHHILEGSILVFGEDITTYEEIRRMEILKTKTLVELNTKLERSNQSLEQFSRMVSHDLKNGLNRIQGFSRMLTQSEKDNLSAKGLGWLEKIHKNTDYMVLTINRILDFARSKNSKLDITSGNLKEFFHKILTDFQGQLLEVGGKVNVMIEDVLLEADFICLRQVFENLISNSIKYRAKERNLVICIKTIDAGADILIEFSDNGIGIPKGEEEKIFEEYYRTEEIASKVGGHGIGLSTVKILIESHGGIIWVDSNCHIGATFQIQLPKKQ